MTRPPSKRAEILAIIETIVAENAIVKATGEWTDAKSIARMKKERAGYELLTRIEDVRSLLTESAR